MSRMSGGRIIRAALAGLLAAVCAACAAADDAPVAAAAASASIAAQPVARLPLRPGYYVASDTPCAQASNATLHLLRREGDGYGGFTTPPYACAFERIEQSGPTSYRVTETCGDAYGADGDDADTQVVVYEILSDAHYRGKHEDGWENEARRCPRGQLPALWRDEAIGDFVD